MKNISLQHNGKWIRRPFLRAAEALRQTVRQESTKASSEQIEAAFCRAMPGEYIGSEKPADGITFARFMVHVLSLSMKDIGI